MHTCTTQLTSGPQCHIPASSRTCGHTECELNTPGTHNPLAECPCNLKQPLQRSWLRTALRVLQAYTVHMMCMHVCSHSACINTWAVVHLTSPKLLHPAVNLTPQTLFPLPHCYYVISGGENVLEQAIRSGCEHLSFAQTLSQMISPQYQVLSCATSKHSPR